MNKIRCLGALTLCLSACEFQSTMEMYDLVPTAEVTVLERRTNSQNMSKFVFGAGQQVFWMTIDRTTGKTIVFVERRAGDNMFVACDTAHIIYLGKRFEPISDPSKMEGLLGYEQRPTKCPSGSIINASGIKAQGEAGSVAYIEFDLPAQINAPVELTLPRASYYRKGLTDLPQITVSYKVKKFPEGGGWH